MTIAPHVPLAHLSREFPSWKLRVTEEADGAPPEEIDFNREVLCVRSDFLANDSDGVIAHVVAHLELHYDPKSGGSFTEEQECEAERLADLWIRKPSAVAEALDKVAAYPRPADLTDEQWAALASDLMTTSLIRECHTLPHAPMCPAWCTAQDEHPNEALDSAWGGYVHNREISPESASWGRVGISQFERFEDGQQEDVRVELDIQRQHDLSLERAVGLSRALAEALSHLDCAV